MPLFQSSVLKKHLRNLPAETVGDAWEKFTKHFHDPSIQENIRQAKEEQYQEGFLRDLFVNVLGYTLNPEPDYNLTTEFKNVKDAKKADGAILLDGNAVGVIELKGTDTPDLDKVEGQAFGYKNNQPEAVYVVTANFEKLRFYIDNAVEYEEFHLFTLTRERFDLLWLCLAQRSVSKGLPKRIKDESVQEEENVTKKLYKDYSAFKQEVFESMVKLNPEYDRLTLFKKTQKLLDRFLFIFFAEDRLLLPPNSIRLIIDQWTDLRDKYDEYQPLYARYQKYFGYMNTGHKGRQHDIFAYNGGLFEADEVLDNIKIADDILYKHTLNLSHYDFESEVDVNILGHIFEHSLSEIEEITAELEGQEVDKKTSKRKKDGVYYTPRYITKYIVENTVGRLCEEKREELAIDPEEYASERRRTTKKKKELLDRLEAYREWLLGITICDPACGSGAFLNQALEFLIEEHGKIDELKNLLLGGSIVFPDIENRILENNLFGVDINEESVEIAKLSLWLRTAQRGRKLTSLSSNIKCGNSLIDDPEVAGEKAFDWQKEFPQVFAKGGFDVVIGNPPYGAQISKPQQEFYLKKFSTPSYKLDTYSIFLENGLEILSNQAALGFIVPYTWMTIDQHLKLRKYLLRYNIEEIVNLPQKIFADADLDTVITIIRKRAPKKEISVAHSINNEIRTTGKIDLVGVLENPDHLININITKEDSKLLSKIKAFQALENEYEVSQGYIPYRRSDLIRDYGELEGNRIVDERLWHSPVKESEEWKQEIQGRDLSRYYNKESSQFVWYGKHVAGFVAEKFFQSPRILIMEVTRGDRYKISATFVEKEFYNTPSIINIIHPENDIKKLKVLLGILNSKLVTWYHTKVHPKANAVTSIPKILIKDVRRLPIPDISKVDENFLLLVDSALNLRVELNQVVISFAQFVKSKFLIKELTSRLLLWTELDEGGFILELEKCRKMSAKESGRAYGKLPLNEEANWRQYFIGRKDVIKDLMVRIKQIDQGIDNIVYGLYGLSEEEKAVVEQS